jgi:hypothetical protein
MDIEPSMAFTFVVVPVSDTHSSKDGFKTLCHVFADISTAPFTRKVGKSGKICFEREYDIVLLVSVMGVKAQVRWFDCTTVSVQD